jgi:hypothetical protein
VAEKNLLMIRELRCQPLAQCDPVRIIGKAEQCRYPFIDGRQVGFAGTAHGDIRDKGVDLFRKPVAAGVGQAVLVQCVVETGQGLVYRTLIIRHDGISSGHIPVQ